jgi:phospholipid transport system substrate-binding protein
MRYRAVLVLAMALVVLSPLSHLVQAGSPTEELRDRIERLYRASEAPGVVATASSEAATILDEIFDWPRMAEAGLRQHWQARTAAERAEFTRLFARVFRRAYLSQLHAVEASGFQYLGDSISGDHATVRTKIATKQGDAIEVTYALRLDGAGRWRAEDVHVQQVSLMENYRAQFNAVIGRSSYEGLVAKLRELGD